MRINGIALAFFCLNAVFFYPEMASAWQEEQSSRPSRIQFNRDIRPILSAACFRCHGIDANKRQGDLRLDLEADAIRDRESGKVIDPGHPASSELWSRIASSDSSTVMPPPEATRQLTSQEKELLRQWILEGAAYQAHWAFEPIRLPEIPSPNAEYPDWSSEIDRFLLHAMLSQGLKPSPPASKSILLRRLSFTLTGLPPTLEEQALFEADANPAAYEKMVDHYLASSAYGEEMARHWLDLARYGDTHGLHLDNERQMWAYRDWVVRAFQEQWNYRDFTRAQLAGDLIPNASLDQQVATGFLRCNVTTSEGGALDDEFRFRYAVDRTSTTLQTWLGLTAGCAVCHDHKYDPLTMKDYYSVYSYFYNAADPPMDGNISDTAPYLKVPSSKQAEDRDFLAKARDEAAIRLWETAKLELAGDEEVRDASKEESEEPLEDAFTDAAADSISQSSKEEDSESIAAPPAPLIADLPRWKETERMKRILEEPVSEVWIDDVLPMGVQSRNTSRNAADWTEATHEVPMGKRALRFAFGNRYEWTMSGGWIPRSLPKQPHLQFWLKVDRWQPPEAIRLEVKSSKRSSVWVWANGSDDAAKVGGGKPMETFPVPNHEEWVAVDLSLEGWQPADIIDEIKWTQFGGVMWLDGFGCHGSGRAENDVRISPLAWWKWMEKKDAGGLPNEVVVALKQGPEAKDAQLHAEVVERAYAAYVDPLPETSVADARSTWERCRSELAIVETEIPGTFVFHDASQPRQAHLMKRGQYDAPGEEVSPRTPGFLPPMASLDGARKGRLEFADWLLEESNPLTARVAVNRFWQQVFGKGIVITSDDFGNQGTPPSHPELLDWLALRFRDDGWEIRRLMKGLVMTAAFRQQAKMDEMAYLQDPSNTWLSRWGRLRLDAEQIRDNALFVSGLLNANQGGPGAKTYQPPNLWEPVGYGDSNTRYYLQDHGASLYRKSLYCFLKRTAPPPFMSNFDAPNREMSCSRRERSNTPLQALQLMNDIQHVEAARKLAEKTLREGGVDWEARTRYLYRLVLSRAPDTYEQQVCGNLVRRFLDRYRDVPGDALDLLGVGESPMASYLSPHEVAATTMLCNMILNLDETLHRN